MSEPKRSSVAVLRGLLNTFLVLILLAVAGLIGIGGAALLMYFHPGAPAEANGKAKPHAPAITAEDNDFNNLPKLTPVQPDTNTPPEIAAAHYVPTREEVATFTEPPRFVVVSYDGGRQQAELRLHTVTFNYLTTSAVPPPLPDIATTIDPTVALGRPALTDPKSHYITDAQGRVIGVDGSAGAAAEAYQQHQQQMRVARALPVQSSSTTPEVRVATPVEGDTGVVPPTSAASSRYLPTRKALPVTPQDEPPSTFNVRDELSREEDVPVLRAQPVIRPARPVRPTNVLGASDSYQTPGRY